MKKLFLTSSVSFVAKDVAKQIGKKGLKLLFIDTAAEVEEGDLQWLKNDRDALISAGFRVTNYTFTNKTLPDIRKHLEDTDVIYVSGGNTFYLLEKIQLSGCTSVIKDEVNKGKIYIGTSAGSIVAGPDIFPTHRLHYEEKAPKLKSYEGLKLVDFVVFPHWGSDSFRELYLNNRLEHAYNTKNKVILLTDNQFIQVEGEKYQIKETKT